MKDALDILNPRTRFTATATYYDEMPVSPELGGAAFDFEYVSTYSRTWKRLFGNIQSGNAGETAIRSNSQLNFKINGIVILPTGQAFKVIEVAEDYEAAPPQVLRLFGSPVSVETVLRLVSIANPWGIR